MPKTKDAYFILLGKNTVIDQIIAFDQSAYTWTFADYRSHLGRTLLGETDGSVD